MELLEEKLWLKTLIRKGAPNYSFYSFTILYICDRRDGREMEWLYKSPGVDREQYLLGRKIDRQVDPLLASEEREKQVHSHSSLFP